MNILVIGGSNSSDSINRRFAVYVASLIKHDLSTLYDISKIDIPLFSKDLEKKNGIPDEVFHFAKSIDAADLIVISLAENNAAYNVGFKNLLDWTSRISERKTWGEKSMFLMATSPGAGGGLGVLALALDRFPRMGANIIASFSLPKFHENFDDESGIKDEALRKQLLELVEKTNQNFTIK